MKVLLVNQYATDNLGDKLIGKVLKEILEKDYHCVVECKKFELFYPERSLLKGIEEKSKPVKKSKIHYIKTVIRKKIECYSIRKDRIFCILKNTISLEGIDMVVIGGGELIKSNHIFILYLDVWTELVKKIGKSKLILFGVSSDCNFTKKEKQRLERILPRFDYINVRDINSKKTLAKIFNVKIAYSPDVVFAYQKYYKLKYTKRNKIQVSIFDYNSYDFSPIFPSIEEYFTFWYRIIIESAKGELEKVEFFYTTPEDAICTKEFCQKYNRQFGKRITKDFQYNEEQIIRKLAEASTVITGRMHAMIIALQYGAKIIPFEFKEKIKFFAKEWKEKKYSDKTAWEVTDGIEEMFGKIKGIKVKDRIAICTPGFKPVPAVRGGAVEQLTTYLIQMNEKYGDYKFDVITVQDSALDTIFFDNTEIIQVADRQNEPLYKFFYKIINRLYQCLHLEKRVTYIERQIAKECIKKGYKKVLVENDMPIYIEIKRRRPNTELIFHLHNNIDCKDPCKTAGQAKYISETASIIMVVSDFIKKRFEHVTGVSNIEILYNCIDRQLFNPKRFSNIEIQNQKEKLGLKKEDTIIMFLGRLDNQKGVVELIDALLLLEKTESFVCLIIGGNFFGSKEENKYFNKIQEKIRNDKRFICLGMLEYTELPLMYAVADIVVVPSQCEEAFGMVALEAASMKKAVIASYIGGIPDILSKESALYICMSKDYIENLSKALSILINNSVLREKLGQNGYEYTRKKFSDVEDYYLKFKKIINNTFEIGE